VSRFDLAPGRSPSRVSRLERRTSRIDSPLGRDDLSPGRVDLASGRSEPRQDGAQLVPGRLGRQQLRLAPKPVRFRSHATHLLWALNRNEQAQAGDEPEPERIQPGPFRNEESSETTPQPKTLRCVSAPLRDAQKDKDNESRAAARALS
jgi:hypothetical protein